MNNKNDFFTGAGFDEINQNNQGMMNNNMGMQQQPMNNGMMNQQPMPQQNNMFGGMQQQPMMDNQGMMNNNMGMQQPMNNNMMNQQPMPTFNMGGSKKKLNLDLKGNASKVLIMVAILAVVLVLVFVFGHKTLSCTQEMDYGLYEAKMTADIEYWFGKATSKTAIMEMNLEDLDEDQKEQVIEMVENLAEEAEDDDVKVSVKKSKNSVTLKAKQKVSDDDEIGSYDDEKESAIDADFVCK